jgi:two-component system, chemotaxis family, chemotaxis protein CheY
MKCLVVDDSATVRRIVSNALKSTGITDVATADDGCEALTKCDGSVDLVITDWNMPVMGGLDLVRSLRAAEATAKTRVLMVTTRSAQQDIRQAIEAGVSGYIMKPFSPRNLQEKISQIMAAS